MNNTIKSLVKVDLIGNNVVVSLTTCENWEQGGTNEFKEVEKMEFNFLHACPIGTAEQDAVEMLKDDCFKNILFYGLKQKVKDGVASLKDETERFKAVCENLERILSQDASVRSFAPEGGRSVGVTKGQRTFLEASFGNVMVKLVGDMELFLQLNPEKVKDFFVLSNEGNVKGLKPSELNQKLSDKLVEDFVENKEGLLANCSK